MAPVLLNFSIARFLRLCMAAWFALLLVACGGGAGTVGMATGVALYTTAPGTLTITSGSVSYTIGGGTPTYNASSSNPAVVTVSVGSGGNGLNITAVAAGTAQIVVRDVAGASVTISVTVGSGGATTALFATAPAAVTIAVGAGPTYGIGGGTAPYTATSSNASVAVPGVSGATLAITGAAAGTAQVVLRDAVGATVTINVTVGSGGTATAMFTTAPAAVTIAVGATPTYGIGGGTAPFTATSGNAGVATSVISGATVAINGVAAGSAQIIVRDAVGATVTINVTVGSGGSAVALFTTSPGTITLAVGASVSYTISGGTPAYAVSSSNLAVAKIGISGNSFTITGVTAGTTQIVIFDSVGASTGVVVAVGSGGSAVALFTTAPSSITAAVGATITYTISGGTPAYTVSSSNQGVATVGISGASFSISGVAAGTAQIVVRDAVGASVTISLTVGSSASGANGAIRVSLTNASGVTSSAVSTGNSLLAVATVTDDLGVPQKNKIVTFVVSDPIATISPSSGTALTDANGVAQVSLVSAGTGAGAASVTASVTLGTTPIKATANFSVAAPSSPPVIGNGAIQMLLTDSGGVPKNTVTSGKPLIARATVTSTAGVPLANQVVTFTVSTSIVALSPASGTALTDVNGVAQVSVQSAGIGGAGTITASVTVSGGTAAVTATAAYSVGAAPSATPVAINFVGAVPADNSIVLKGSGGSGRTEIAILTFKVVDNTNNGIPNVQVSFSTITNTPSSGATPVMLTGSPGTTDQGGLVTVTLNSGSEPTTVRVIATTVIPPTVTALSDTVTVTTGQPAQAAFSLSLTQFYVEGLDYDNTQITVSALLADKFGAAVADGTQVVFVTDTGAIVGSGGAKCVTVSGACSVKWRSQNPRPPGTDISPKGLATIVASATNAGSSISGTLQFYNSGSFANVYKVTSSSVAGTTVKFASGVSISTESVLPGCGPETTYIEVTDVNYNPMPEGTILAATNLLNATVQIFPATVVNTGMHLGGKGTTRGTIHQVVVTPYCDIFGKPISGNFTLTVTSPKGNQTAVQFIAPAI
jgi:hypothetical protein